MRNWKGMPNDRIGPELRARIAAAWPEVCAEVAAGGHVGNAYAARGFTRGNAAAFLAENRDARVMWEEAREQSADSFFDQMQEIANNPGPDPKSARVKLDALRWLAGKRNPRYYGERTALDVNVKTIDLTKTIEAAQARLAAARDPLLADRAARAVDAEILTPLLGNALKDML